MNSNDTIAAIATAPGESAIGIVRASGPGALTIADKVFRCSAPVPSERDGNQFVYGHVHHPARPSEAIDEAILLVYTSPNSYTREHAIEIQCHGGTTSARRILSALVAAGARPSEPGEFTRRAFLAGRIDLAQAEAVLDLIHARTDQAASSALQQLDGSLSNTLTLCYDALLESGALVEATLDFDKDELPADALDGLQPDLESASATIRELLETWGEGRLLREGALVAITGAPNVGKSTLLNALLGTDRAIVHDRPGTTRDTIEESLVLDGLLLRLVDTAGMRETDCDVERAGISRAVQSSEMANARLHVIDASTPFDDQQGALIADVDMSTTLVVLNKTDLGQKVGSDDLLGFKCVSASLLDGSGLSAIQKALLEMLHFTPSHSPHATVSERHRALLESASSELESALSLLAAQDPANHVLVATHIRSSVEALGQITGRSYDQDLLDSIFSQFCIGK